MDCPWGLKWRSSVWFITLVVGFGVMTDLLVYSIVIPVFPFRLESLGYKHVSGLVSFLLFAFSGGLVVSTPPIALLSERYKNRKVPLLMGMVALIGSQIMLMEAPRYWVLAVGRVIQGISSSVVWVLGLALLCDTTPKKYVGRESQADRNSSTTKLITRVSFSGSSPARPQAARSTRALASAARSCSGCIVTFVDLVGRLLIIERKEALLWGVDPMAVPDEPEEENVEKAAEEGTGVAEKTERSLAQAESREKADDTEDRDLRREDDAVKPQCSTGAAVKPKESVNRSELSAAATDAGQPVPAQARSQTAASEHESVHLSPLGVLVKLGTSSRAVTVMVNTLIYGIAYSAQEPVLPLHMQATWGFNSSKVGLVMIACVVPTLFSSPLSGWYADRRGTEWITLWCTVLSIPFWVIEIIPILPLFIVALAMQSFFTCGVVSPLMAELASISRNIDGIGYAHVYGAFNLCFGVGSAIGPLISGQLYDHVKHGWSGVSMPSVSSRLDVYPSARFWQLRTPAKIPFVPECDVD
ncbi:major facilitator MFS-1 [Punctularia strigosozonata HHB-11173 SS5]|uniref:major facilitator MFS-1 n=1 Tax=Punctularia strigosozonata (strain HHB-11173) TaxID=741275 RepID=UPI0004416D2B|nr:major facilitator MFS-1 [Punctularia strigosozonata HHB-11173 SS5]EIN13358.1 major facilitator MFS-1 [Punctularia strigosozonata HHB-11173 SS5]